MRIVIRSAEAKSISLRIPARLLLNSVTAKLGAKWIQKHAGLDGAVQISAGDLRRWIRELHRVRKKHRHLNVIDVESAKGDRIHIRL